jgi:septal ring factor EnvC (AmiA/AmiB activator)
MLFKICRVAALSLLNQIKIVNMKNSIICFLICVVAFSSCNQAELEQLKEENHQLRAEIEQREQDISGMIKVFNEIEDNLSNVRTREERILKYSRNAEGSTDKIDDIQGEIIAIDELMKKNRENLSLLGERLKTTTGEKHQLEKMMANLHSVVNSKDREIVELVRSMEDLNLQIEDLYGSITDLKVEKAKQEFTIDMQEKALNRGYYLIASTKKLREMGVIERSGGILGIGRVSKLADDLDLAMFTMVDIREENNFSVDAHKVELLSSHPGDSYILRKSEDDKRFLSLEITRPADFWKTTRTLVIAMD